MIPHGQVGKAYLPTIKILAFIVLVVSTYFAVGAEAFLNLVGFVLFGACVVALCGRS